MFRLSISISIGGVGERTFTRGSWQRVREAVKRRDGAFCQYCGRRVLDGEADHILPLSRGGTDAIHNLAWSCKTCNTSKGDKTLVEWLGALHQVTPVVEPIYPVDVTPRHLADGEHGEIYL